MIQPLQIKEESIHEASVKSLIDRFGNRYENEIKRRYAETRAELEKNAKFRDYIPLLVIKAVREILEKIIKKT